MKSLFLSLILIATSLFSRADEGMWIPLLLEQLNEKEMQDMGFKLTAEDIYSINKSSMKDGIVIFGGGCTGELVSDQGLLLTNHHCGYGSIQRHSSLENDYLTDGFWAMSREEELPNPGLSVTFLVRMEDVTDKMLEGVESSMNEAKRKEILDANAARLEAEAINGTHYKARVKPFYHGNQYYLFVTEVYEDIRLVGAPPSNIGKFGGDTDNWMWPRHTGDFSVFRIYADSNNQPAAYSENNVPFKPKYHFPINIQGVEEDDFTFVFGYPGSTQQYIPACRVDHIAHVVNPIRIDLRGKRLDIIDKYIESDDLVRIQYSAKAASIANGWKKWIGENKGIERTGIVERKKRHEHEFSWWVGTNQARKSAYGGIIDSFEELYGNISPLEKEMTYISESVFSIELIRMARYFDRLVTQCQDKESTDEDIANTVSGLQRAAGSFFKNYHRSLDMEVFEAMIRAYVSLGDPAYRPEALAILDKKFNGDVNAFTDYVFEESFLDDESEVIEYLGEFNRKDHKKLLKDPAFKLAGAFAEKYNKEFRPQLMQYYAVDDSLQRIYMKGLMDFQPDKRFYPDANFTLRVTYGKVKGYQPRDAVTYNYFTTLEGIMEKEDPNIYDYVVEDRLKELYDNKDYGRYADDDGSMHTCFIATNHTSGGNSGSPLLNGNGELVGINFDRCWEGTMSDIVYDAEQCRNISIDIRYCLFIIDKFAGAGHLVDEMTIIE
ncbi:MAG TPA: S46 family peptidase [Bacteroidales bacterium]|nr:S46 family peptidase [Bacteroidales bacterium]